MSIGGWGWGWGWDAGGGPYDAYLLYDTFTDDNAVTLTNHTPDKAPDGSSWAEDTTGKLVIASNQISRVAGGGNRKGFIDTGVTAQDIQATVTLSANDSNVGILFNYQDSSNYAYVILYLAASVRFYTYIASSSVLEVLNNDLVPVVETPYVLRVTTDGTTVSVYIDGDLLFSDVPAALPVGTLAGIMTFAGTGCLIDDFSAASF